MFSFLVFFSDNMHVTLIVVKDEWLNHYKKNIKKISKQFLKKTTSYDKVILLIYFLSTLFLPIWLKITGDSDTNISLVLTKEHPC